MKRIKIPSISRTAEKLFFICLVIILAYLACTVVYILCSIDPLMQNHAVKMLQNAWISLTISLCATLLLDCEIRRSGKEL